MLNWLFRRSVPPARTFNPKVVWWNDERWLSRFERHLRPDAGPTGVGDWKRILDRRFTLAQFAGMVLRLRGQTAECGVFTGVSSAVICEVLRDSYSDGERHWAFDSFAGLPEPTTSDGDAWNSGDLTANYATARQHLKEFPFCELVQGWIPEVLEPCSEFPFRFAHIDLDLYEPTAHALAFFYPRLVNGGIIVCDDYGFRTCPGARQAVDEFVQNTNAPLVELTTGQAVLFRLATNESIRGGNNP
ncbi:MAG: class I SAM-dependent methyltransferase [Planctomycetales bacterium]|nr:class I SAM-dependent methyltransferase [Planctomycetales bacterium]